MTGIPEDAAGQGVKWRMGRVLAFANQKGGVGKTTTVVNLSACLGELGQRVLVVDADAQGNCTTGLGVDKRSLPATLYEVILDQAIASDVLLHTAVKGVDLLPANVELAGAEIELVSAPSRERRMADVLRRMKPLYDLVLIDCPPSLGLLTLNALVAADSVLVPLQCEYYALEGLSQLVHTLRRVAAGLNPGLEISGAFLTMFDARTNLSAQVMADAKAFFGDRLFRTVIPRNVRIAEAPSHGLPIGAYDPHSKGAEAYLELAREVLEREQRQERVG